MSPTVKWVYTHMVAVGNYVETDVIADHRDERKKILFSVSWARKQDNFSAKLLDFAQSHVRFKRNLVERS